MSIFSPEDTERFHLKLLSYEIKGATSFKNLLTVNKTLYKTYKEAAVALGLIEDDKQKYKIFDEACKIMMPYQLRKFFVCFFLAENIQGNLLWNKYENFFFRGL